VRASCVDDLEIAVCAADEDELMIVKLCGKRVGGLGSRGALTRIRGERRQHEKGSG